MTFHNALFAYTYIFLFYCAKICLHYHIKKYYMNTYSEYVCHEDTLHLFA